MMIILRSAILVVLFAVSAMVPFMNAAYAQEPLVFGIHPYMTERELHERFGPLATHLSRKIGQPIKVVVARDYEEQIDKMGADKLDLAFMGPASYIKMVDRHGKKSILGRLETNGKPTYHGVIFVARDSPLRSISDLRGKRFAFGDPNSTMSYLVPEYLLWKAGVTVDKLGAHAFLGKQDNVALGVLSGDFDAGAVKEDVFLQYEKRGLKVLVRTAEFSDHLFVAGNKLPEKTVQALRMALSDLKNDDEGRAILSRVKEGVTGIVPAKDNDYDTMRDVLRQLAKLGIKRL